MLLKKRIPFHKKINTNNEIIFIDTPAKGKSQNPPIKDIGIPSETQNANLGFKKSAKTITTNSAFAYSGFNANNPGFANVITTAVNNMEK